MALPAAAQITAAPSGFGAHAAAAADTGTTSDKALARLSAPASPAAKATPTLQAYLGQAPASFSGAPLQAPPRAQAGVSTTLASTTATSRPLTSAEADQILSLAPPDANAALPTHGLSAGQAVRPFLPTADSFDHATAQAIIAAFNTPKGKTAEDAASAAATPAPADPAFDERVALVITLYQVDGTDKVIRHYVDTEHMKLIIAEVANHIDIGKLSQTDKVRLASIAAVAQTELEDKIIAMNARVEAANLSKDELMQLIVAYDTDAQRKQTELRLHDDGRQDQIAGIDVIIAEYTILRTFLSAE